MVIKSKSPKPVEVHRVIPAIRASSLPMLFSCPRLFMQKTQAEDYGKDAGEEPAQTGSLVHLGIAAFHAANGKTHAGIAAIERGASLYPLANQKKAMDWFLKYPGKFERRWTKNGYEVRFIEKQVTFTIPLTEGKTVPVTGTIDLVLESCNDWAVIDHKSGQPPIDWMKQHYDPQLAGYMAGAKETLIPVSCNKPVFGYINRLQDLHHHAGDCFHKLEFDLAGANTRLKQAGALLALHTPVSIPGKHCSWCSLCHPHCYLTPEGTGGVAKEKGRQPLKVLTKISDVFTRKV